MKKMGLYPNLSTQIFNEFSIKVLPLVSVRTQIAVFFILTGMALTSDNSRIASKTVSRLSLSARNLANALEGA
ncbi:MAG: hypothetical protein JXR76_00500 [Deltaproteobacteria bacterium]|nr:hypothetical protein [Deltaproteobacteria bacterium]